MNRRRLLTVAVAAALAVLGVVLILGYVHRVEHQPIPHGAQAFTATTAIPEGTPILTAIKKHWVKRVLYPAATLPADYILWPSHDQIDGGFVFTSNIGDNQLVLSGMIGPKEAVSTLPPPPNAPDEVGIVVCQSAAVGGFVTVGTKVTITDTYAVDSAHALTATCAPHPPPPGGQKTKVVLPNVLVLSVGDQPPAQASPTSPTGSLDPTTTQQTANAPGCEAATQGQVCVVVAVTAADVLKLVNYDATGDLSLAITTGAPVSSSATYP